MNQPSTFPVVDVAANRAATKWSRKELVGRALWETLGAVAFSLSPRQCWEIRNGILRLFGARVGREVHVHPTVKIAVPWHLTLGNHVAVGDRATLYSLGSILIGDRATISQCVHLCAGTHDYRDPAMPLVKAPIEVGPDAWICADAFIGPGVSIGARAIVGARAVVVSDVASHMIVGGNPAREIKRRDGAQSEARS